MTVQASIEWRSWRMACYEPVLDEYRARSGRKIATAAEFAF
jgi:hypothetical protein